MKVPTPADRKIRGRILALSVACPFDGCDMPECPFHKIRKMSLRVRYEWAKSMNEEEANRLIECHTKCVDEKMSNLPSWW